MNSELIHGAHNSCLKIDSLLELLQDRRRQLDKGLKQQQQELGQVLKICQWDQQENQVTQRGVNDILTSANEVWLLCGLDLSWDGSSVAMIKFLGLWSKLIGCFLTRVK